MLTIVGLTLVGVAGVLLLVYVRPAGRLAHDLAVALRPLSLPLLVLVLVAAARALPLTMAAAVFVVVLFAAARLVVLPEVHDLRRGCSLLVAMFVLHQERRATPVIGITPAAVRAGLPRPVTVLWLSVWFFVVPGLFMVAVLSPSVWLAGRISWVTALAEGAVVLSGAALLVRLFGFSRKPLRAACAVLICLLAARGLVLAGFLPGEGWIRDLPNWHWLSPRTIALWLAVALVLCVLVESLYAACGRPTGLCIRGCGGSSRGPTRRSSASARSWPRSSARSSAGGRPTEPTQPASSGSSWPAWRSWSRSSGAST
jgi:hypothetical protein